MARKGLNDQVREANASLHISKRGLDLIKHFEGYHDRLPDGRCKAYLDTIANPPVWTIGYGCTEGVTEGMIWTEEQAERELLREIAIHELEVKRLIKVPLNQYQFDALVSFSYNYGLARAKTLRGHVDRGDFQAAGNSLVQVYPVVRGKGVISGLLRRRKAERDLMWTLPPKEVVASSRKLTLLSRIRSTLLALLPVGAFSDYLGYFEQVKDYIVDKKYFFILALFFGAWMLMKWFENKSIEDHENGNYTPSKATSYTEENEVDVDAINNDTEASSDEAPVSELDTEYGPAIRGAGEASGTVAQ